MEQKTETKKVPVVPGWFSLESPFRLIGNRCATCGDYFFPKVIACRNPNCRGTTLEEAYFGTRGKLWSFTTNYYQPPAPYVSPDPFVPYTIAVVDLPVEKLMVAGQVVKGVDPDSLRVGMEMDLVMDTLYEDPDGTEHVIWMWKPAA